MKETDLILCAIFSLFFYAPRYSWAVRLGAPSPHPSQPTQLINSPEIFFFISYLWIDICRVHPHTSFFRDENNPAARVPHLVAARITIPLTRPYRRTHPELFCETSHKAIGLRRAHHIQVNIFAAILLTLYPPLVLSVQRASPYPYTLFNIRQEG